MMDPFATLGIDRRFDVDLAQVERRHRELSRALHPDKYAAAAPSERLLALGRAASVNDAWRIVRDPIRRAEALFSLSGIAVGETNEPKQGGAFLMEMLEQREALAEAKASRDLAAIAALAKGIEAHAHACEAKLARGFFAANGSKSGLEPLVPCLGEMRFYRRFLDEVSAIEDEFDGSHGASRNF